MDQEASATCNWDHPRLRGEYSSNQCNIRCPQGSPPLARGIHIFKTGYYDGIGITPACAGNTSCLPCPNCAKWDHPRLRGEYFFHLSLAHHKLGSPPLAQGILVLTCNHIAFVGITPACAGNTSERNTEGSEIWDHPRLRGEYIFQSRLHVRRTGSPPLARGIRRKR